MICYRTPEGVRVSDPEPVEFVAGQLLDEIAAYSPPWASWDGYTLTLTSADGGTFRYQRIGDPDEQDVYQMGLIQ